MKKTPGELKAVLDSSVETVSFIKSRPMHCFTCSDGHVQLLLHAEEGRPVLGFFELHRDDLTAHKLPLSDVFEDTVWLSQLTYWSDVSLV